MRIIIASTPAAGHIDPLIGVARTLASQGHALLFLTGSVFRDRIEKFGIKFAALPEEIDFDLRNLDACFPERIGLGTGESLAYDMDRIFIGPMAAQFRRLSSLVESHHADVVIAEQLFLGAVPLVLTPRETRPIVVGCGITFLGLPREDGLPHGIGLPFTSNPQAAAKMLESVLPALKATMAPVQSQFEGELRKLGVTPAGSPLDVLALHADIFWQGGIPEIDYPRSHLPDHVHHVGLWPQAPTNVELPAWAEKFEDGRRLVLVTQGTVANSNLEQLVVPTMRALADRKDLIVIGTSGGRDCSDVSVPANAHLVEYLPFDLVLPHVSAVVTNGGYGTVLQALSCGVPLVVAGATEDKPEIAARIAWSGAGIDLKTAFPGEAAIHDAVEALLAPSSTFRSQSQRFARQFSAYDSAKIIARCLAPEQYTRRLPS